MLNNHLLRQLLTPSPILLIRQLSPHGRRPIKLNAHLYREQVKQLKAELKRKDAALAEAAALLLLSKKAEALWEEEDASTTLDNDSGSLK